VRARHVIGVALVAGVIGALMVIALTIPQPRAAATTEPAAVRPARAATVRHRPVRHRHVVVLLRMPANPVDRFVRVPVLMYHRVTAAHLVSTTEQEFTVRPADFAAQMDWLQQNGYTPIREAQLLRAIVDGASLPAHPVLITFDDGYVDAVHAILHTLITRTRHFPATFFVITGRIGRGQFVSWRDLRVLTRNGMDIGSHTVWHTHLAQVGPAAQRFEVTHSARTLARGLGHPIYWFSYPFGSVDPSATAAVRAAGYLLAYTTQTGTWLSTGQHLTLPRLLVPGNMTLAQFANDVRFG
jgi:peptidoglycan/xylan/chitin deacetylase (PgdA/CDA1 family)